MIRIKLIYISYSFKFRKYLLEYKKACEATGLSYPSMVKSCKSLGRVEITKNNIKYRWMYLKDYLNN